MNHQPHEYWLKYMLLFSGATLDQIVQAARLYQMVPPTLEYLRALRDQLDGTKPSPFRMNSGATRAWVRRQRVMSMANNDPAATEARELLSDNKIRPILETLLMTDIDLNKVVLHVHTMTGRAVSKEVVDRFRHYFWNRDIMSLSDWMAYLDDHPNGRDLLSCRKQGEEFALWKLGHRVELSKQEILQTIMHESAMRFVELNGYSNGMKTAMAAKFWADNVFKSVQALDQTGDSVKQVVDNLREVAIKLGRREISSVEKVRKLPKE